MVQKSVQIKADSLANIYLFCGEEAYKKRNYKEKLRKVIAGSTSVNYSYFEGKDIDLNAVYDSVVTLPFFAEKRLVIVENSGRFAAKKGADDKAASGDKKQLGDKKTSGDDAILERIINECPESTCLAFFEVSAAKNKRVYKEINKKGVVCECNPDGPEQVKLWLAKGFAQAGKKIKTNAATLLIDRVGTDYDRLRTEYDKIISYVGDNEEITVNDIIAVTSEDIEAKIFDMLGAMSMKNKKEVMERYYELLANKEPPLKMLAMIRTQVRTVLQVSEFTATGLSDYDIADKMGVQKFKVTKSRQYGRGVSTKELMHMLDEISETDRRIKTGDITDQLGVETLLISLSS